MLPGLFMLLAGAGIALAIGLWAEPIGRTLGLMDHPDHDGGRKLHARATPLVGGVALVCAVVVACVALLVAGPPETDRAMLGWFMVSVVGLFLVGVLDDRFELTARTRLALASLVLLTAISQVPDFGVSFLLFSGQDQLILMPGLFGLAFTLLSFVGLLNAVNMADGKNGLVIGQAIIWALVLLVRSPGPMAPVLLAILGALVVLFWFNMQGRLFLGDGGSYGLSAMFGLLAIHAWNGGFADMRADDVALIFAVPVFDTLRLIVHRLSQGKSPFTPGRDHLHHYLHARWGWPRPLPWVLALVLLPNLGALAWPGTGLFWLIATLAGYFGLLWAATTELGRRIA
jgi:UDP-GlcNAc:undecaprenyl-phosphate GlcNAc-1-phosphate transferase